MKKIIAGAAIGAVFTVVALIIAEEYKRWRRRHDAEGPGGCDCQDNGGATPDQQTAAPTQRQVRDKMMEQEAIAFERDQLDHTLATLDRQPYPSPKMA